MSAKILPFRVPLRSKPLPTSKLVSCPFCSFFSDRAAEIDRHMNADHARAMALYGFKRDKDKQTS